MKFPLIETFKNSVYSPEFYRELDSKPFSFSLKYFFKIALVLVIVLTAITSLELIPRINFFISNLGPEFLSGIPENIEIKIVDGKATSNLEEPYSVPMPQSFLSTQENEADIPKNLLVINTQGPFESDKFDSYDTLLLLTNDSIVRGEEGQVQIIKLSELGDRTITKPYLQSLFDKLPVFLKWLAPIVVVGIFIAFFFAFLVNLFYALVVSIIVFIIQKAKKLPARFKKSYQLSLHAISLSIFIDFIGFVFFPKVDSSAILFILLAVIIAWINLFKDKITTSPVPANQ